MQLQSSHSSLSCFHSKKHAFLKSLPPFTYYMNTWRGVWNSLCPTSMHSFMGLKRGPIFTIVHLLGSFYPIRNPWRSKELNCRETESYAWKMNQSCTCDFIPTLHTFMYCFKRYQEQSLSMIINKMYLAQTSYMVLYIHKKTNLPSLTN